MKESPPGVRQRGWDEAFNHEPSLAPQEHSTSRSRLRAMMSDEQRRRVDRVLAETRGLSMPRRLDVAKEFLLPPIAHFPAEAWDAAFNTRLEGLTQ